MATIQCFFLNSTFFEVFFYFIANAGQFAFSLISDFRPFLLQLVHALLDFSFVSVLRLRSSSHFVCSSFLPKRNDICMFKGVQVV